MPDALLDLFEWPIACNYDGDIICCQSYTQHKQAKECGHEFDFPSTPRELLRAIANHVEECPGA